MHKLQHVKTYIKHVVVWQNKGFEKIPSWMSSGRFSNLLLVTTWDRWRLCLPRVYGWTTSAHQCLEMSKSPSAIVGGLKMQSSRGRSSQGLMLKRGSQRWLELERSKSGSRPLDIWAENAIVQKCNLREKGRFGRVWLQLGFGKCQKKVYMWLFTILNPCAKLVFV